MHATEPLAEEFPGHSRLRRAKSNRRYLIVPVAGEQIAVENLTGTFISIDPEVGPFLTSNDSSQIVVEVRKNADVCIEKLKRRRRQLQPNLSKLRKHKKRQTYWRALNRLDERASHVVDEMVGLPDGSGPLRVLVNCKFLVNALAGRQAIGEKLSPAIWIQEVGYQGL